MGFTPGQFSVGERVQVRCDTRHSDYITFAGMSGVVEAVNRSFRTWHDSDVSYDYSYTICFDAPSPEEMTDVQRRKLVRLANNTRIPGRYLEPAATTMLIRKAGGRWRNAGDVS